MLSDLFKAGDQYVLARDTICSFAGPWKPMHLRVRPALIGGTGLEEEDGNPSTFSFYRRHEIRCFSSRDPYCINLNHEDGPRQSYLDGNRDSPHYYPMPFNVPPKGLATSRESGIFPSLQNASTKRFTEKRLSVVCLASDFDYASSMPSFRTIVINDFPEMIVFSEDDFNNWRTSGLRIEGTTAWQMTFQASIFGLVPIWEREWATCLDELDNSVRVKVRHT